MTKQPNGLSILFADDEESLQELMRMELPRMGHTVTVCADGDQAVQEASQQHYDCLLVDLDMPRMNGIEVIQRLYQIDGNVTILLSSGYTEEEISPKFGEEKPAEFLQKPYDMHKLIDAVRKCTIGPQVVP